MTTEDHPRHDQEDLTEEHSFDVLARSLADGTLSRQRALKLVGAAVLGSALSIFTLPDDAHARRHKKKKHRHTTPPPPPAPPGTCAHFASNCCDPAGTPNGTPCTLGKCLCQGPEVCFADKCCTTIGATCNPFAAPSECCSGSVCLLQVGGACCIPGGGHCAPGTLSCCNGGPPPLLEVLEYAPTLKHARKRTFC
jgi:hypothetical protein